MMAKNKKPTRKYTPKRVKVPVTGGLFDEFGRDLHFSMMAIRAGSASASTWKKVAKIMLTVSYATDSRPDLAKESKVAIDSAVLAVKSVSDRQVRTGKWHVPVLELTSIERGVIAVERLLPHLDYTELNKGYLTLVSAMQSIEE